MLSRVAESMFWMSRYIERAENTARLLDVNFHLLLDLNKVSDIDAQTYWDSLLEVTTGRERFHNQYEQCNAETVTDYMVFNRDNPNSIYSCVAMARENGRSIIETISSEMWEQVNNLYHFVRNTDEPTVKNDPYSFYQTIKNGSHIFQGITDSTLSHNEGWEFVQAGRYLERADNTARLIDVKYGLLQPQAENSVYQDLPDYESADIIQWMAVLKSCSALEAFRKVYGARIDPHTILRFLVLDTHFPRSIYFAVSSMQGALWRISGSARRKYTNNVDRLVGKFEAELSYTTIEDIYQEGLHNYLEGIEGRLAQIGEQIYEHYFAYHTGNVQFSEQHEFALWFNALDGGLAQWSQIEQQQQQQQ